MGLRVHRQVGALWKVLSQQAVGVLVRAALPGALRIAKIDVDFGRQTGPILSNPTIERPSKVELKSPGSLIGLPKSKQRTAVAVAAGFVPTHEAPGVALGVALLPFEVIDPFSKIEPDYSVSRAMSLRLSLIAEWAQWRGGRIRPAACNNQRCQQAHRVRK
jgi:hypothetical protein